MDKCFELIAQQQGTDKKNKIYWVGEQLKDIVRATPGAAELVTADIENGGMTLTACEAKIAAYARQNGGCCPPQAADEIMREYFGLGKTEEAAPQTSGTLSLADYL